MQLVWSDRHGNERAKGWIADWKMFYIASMIPLLSIYAMARAGFYCEFYAADYLTNTSHNLFIYSSDPFQASQDAGLQPYRLSGIKELVCASRSKRSRSPSEHGVRGGTTSSNVSIPIHTSTGPMLGARMIGIPAPSILQPDANIVNSQ